MTRVVVWVVKIEIIYCKESASFHYLYDTIGLMLYQTSLYIFLGKNYHKSIWRPLVKNKIFSFYLNILSSSSFQSSNTKGLLCNKSNTIQPYFVFVEGSCYVIIIKFLENAWWWAWHKMLQTKPCNYFIIKNSIETSRSISFTH